jgi:hypothetical protein
MRKKITRDVKGQSDDSPRLDSWCNAESINCIIDQRGSEHNARKVLKFTQSDDCFDLHKHFLLVLGARSTYRPPRKRNRVSFVMQQAGAHQRLAPQPWRNCNECYQTRRDIRIHNLSFQRHVQSGALHLKRTSIESMSSISELAMVSIGTSRSPSNIRVIGCDLSMSLHCLYASAIWPKVVSC